MALIGDGWADYYQILPKNASPVQISETKRAFYSGAAYLYGSLVGGLKDKTEGDALALMRRISTEIDIFVEDIRNGKA